LTFTFSLDFVKILTNISGFSDFTKPKRESSDSIALKILFLSKSEISALSIPVL
jgi:hypothetical protein